MSTFKSAVVLLLCQSCLLAADKEKTPARMSILPRPVIERATGRIIVLAGKAEPMRIVMPQRADGPVAEGYDLLRRRIVFLGHDLASDKLGSTQVNLTLCDDKKLAQLLKNRGIDQKLEPARSKQAYHLAVESSHAGKPLVTIEAVHEWGLYYGMVSLCQLLDTDASSSLCVPEADILDFPEIAHRLAKTCTNNPVEVVEKFSAWLRLFKISQIGLHFIGKDSKHPGPVFTKNIKTLCPKLRRAGTLESIVYFSPFRFRDDKKTGPSTQAYDMSSEADRAAYGEYLLWIMSQGAHGIEVDYNDWGGNEDVKISDVLTYACEKVKKRYPDAYVLYCPPGKGPELYFGKATPALSETLSRTPAEVWPLWTGPHVGLRMTLTNAHVQEWTRIAGRRPFLWLNRVTPGWEASVSRQLPGIKDSLVFNGEMLPRELNQLFEGVHLNAGLSKGYNTLPTDFDASALAYLATAADYLWNPHQWQAEESHRRAVHLVEVMLPLQEDRMPK